MVSSSKLLLNELQYMISINAPPRFSISPRYFTNHRAAHVLLCALWRRPSLRSLPTCATGSTLYVMGGRLRFLGHACSSYTCMGSALDVMDYGLATYTMYNCNRDNTTTIFHQKTGKLHKHAHVTLQHLYIYMNVCLCPCTF